MISLINTPIFREQPGRKRQESMGQPDTLVVQLKGPSATRDQWVPASGSPHSAIDPEGYSLMACVDVQDVENGVVDTISATYKGVMLINGIKPQVVYSINRTQQTASVQLPCFQTTNNGKSQVIGAFVNGTYMTAAEINAVSAPNAFVSFGTSIDFQWIYGQVGVITKYGWATLTIEHIVQEVTAKYFSLVRPKGPIGYNDGAEIVQILNCIVGTCNGLETTSTATGETNQQLAMANWPGGPEWSSLTPPKPTLICTAFTAEMVANNTYFNCSETWSMKYITKSHVDG
jgi:hypothetical protein